MSLAKLLEVTVVWIWKAYMNQTTRINSRYMVQTTTLIDLY
jgi:hypothetical protein